MKINIGTVSGNFIGINTNKPFNYIKIYDIKKELSKIPDYNNQRIVGWGKQPTNH